jgi:hypothetical protein
MKHMQIPFIGRRTMLGAMAAVTFAGRAAAAAAVPIAKAQPGTPSLSLGAFDPAATNYSLEEFFISGTATAYQELSPPDAHGNWHVKAAGTAPYVTRIVVIRPLDTKNFNGAVMVEWLNESGGFDFPPTWNMARREIIRSGSAYVAVSAQAVGIEGGKTVFGMEAKGLKQTDPTRYGTLSHPGDAYSFSIFSQTASLLKSKHAGGVLGNLVPKQVTAAGESQSAAYLTTYVNAVDPIARTYDGFLIYSRFGNSAQLDGSGMFKPGPVQFVKMADKLRAPTMIVETETDVLGPFGYWGARQPDQAHLRVWEIAGTAHADAYLFTGSAIDTGHATPAALAGAYALSNDAHGVKLDKPYNNGPQTHYVIESAIAHLTQWVGKGAPPPHAKPFELTATGNPKLPALPVLDANGNIKGGIRTPWVDVPTSKLTGYGNSGSPAAILFGTAEPFTPAQLAKLYPGGKTQYLKEFEASLDATIKSGFILPADKDEIMGIAAVMYNPAG